MTAANSPQQHCRCSWSSCPTLGEHKEEQEHVKLAFCAVCVLSLLASITPLTWISSLLGHRSNWTCYLWYFNGTQPNFPKNIPKSTPKSALKNMIMHALGSPPHPPVAITPCPIWIRTSAQQAYMPFPSTTMIWTSAHSPLQYLVFVSAYDSGLHLPGMLLTCLVALAAILLTCCSSDAHYRLRYLQWQLQIRRWWCDKAFRRVRDAWAEQVETRVKIRGLWVR